jgi:hypothetical protein
MSAHVASALHHRFAVPAWLLAAAIAAVLALGVVALIGDSGSPTASGAATTHAVQPTTCIDAQTVGHC